MPAVAIVPPRRCHWGGFSLVEATLDALELLLEGEFDHAVLLSGQDYPVSPPRRFERRLSALDGRSVLRAVPLPIEYWGAEGGCERYERWHVVSRRALHVRLPWRRRLPGGLVPYGGGMWWALSRPAVEHVVHHARTDRSLMRFFKHVLIPDEMFFQTVIMNSHLRDTLVNEDIHYLRWAEGAGRPSVLQAEDLGPALAAGFPFARKFDVEVAPEALDLLDAALDREEAIDGDR